MTNISIHAPHAGCDARKHQETICIYNFNPRTPCGVRHNLPRQRYCNLLISIHAPHAGCDILKLPLRLVRKISIHAPHAGCDKTPSIMHFGKYLFQSTHPMRGATERSERKAHKMLISIHAPHAGCDQLHNCRSCCCTQFQSTHPMRGATNIPISCICIISYFNPRTPCGVRRRTNWQHYRMTDFNPRTPCGVRLLGSPRTSTSRTNFNPRTPCGVRPNVSQDLIVTLAISIHAPHAGCDLHRRPGTPALSAISIHAPHAGCDTGRRTPPKIQSISIHAPHAGCDTICFSCYCNQEDFNPRTPCGVRLYITLSASLICYFNPRTPCGVRPY